jgi:hypothetical protein
VPRDTGFPTTDAQFDFGRARRQRLLSRLADRLRREPSDVHVILPFDEVLEALGRRGEHYAGLESIPLDSIVGTVDRTRDFDRGFRPTSGRTRERWEKMAEAQRRGVAMPPIAVYRVGRLHFVRDGHHRVSVARALGLDAIDAYVTEIDTQIPADPALRAGELPLKGHERIFSERVPLPPEARDEVRLSDAWGYAALAEGVEAWGFRVMQDRGELMTREQVAREWLELEFRPVVSMLRDAGLVGRGTPADAYMHVAAERYRLMRTHEWSDAVIERLRRELG